MKKVCSGCKVVKPKTSEFFKMNKDYKDGFRGQCRECERLLDKKRRETPEYKKRKRDYDRKRGKEKRKELTAYLRDYRHKNKKKMWAYQNIKWHEREAQKRKLPNNFSEKDWEICKNEFLNCCAYCGKNKKLEKEHFVPISKGGEYTKNNIIPSCKSCNSSKRNKDFFQWYRDQLFYSKKRERKILMYLNYKSNKTQQLSIL